jgi:hypothetical protein
MSLLTRGINKLSQLEIDTNKDWHSREIANIKAVANNMEYGDVVFRGGSILERLTADAGKGYNFLRSRGPGLSPVWQDIESLVQYMTGAVNRAVAFDLSIPSPAISQISQQASSPPGRVAMGLLYPPEPEILLNTQTGPGGAVGSSPSLDIPSPEVSGKAAIGAPLNGAVADDGSIQTNETTQANNDTANDMTLLPTTPAVGDAYYFGKSSMWDWLEVRIGTAGIGTWDIEWEYWNGTGWASLPDVVDNTSGFRIAGTRLMSFTKPVDWAPASVGGVANLYWIRARVSAYTSIVTQPKGTRAFTWLSY